MDTVAEENRGYFVTNAAGQKVDVCFEPLTADDLNVLNGEDWRSARFREVWLESAEYGTGLKLTCCAGEIKPILGLVRLGSVPEANGTFGAMIGSLLETNPCYQHGETPRSYRGIGRVLVARLIAASQAQGAQGRLFIRPIDGSRAFYIRLGFQVLPNQSYMRLRAQEAATVLQQSLFSEQTQESKEPEE